VRELGAEITRDYEGREPVLVGSLKACIPFITDLSRAIPIHHNLDFIELAGYGEDAEGIRFLKDLDAEIEGRHVILVDAVIDTGMTMHYLTRSMAVRDPASLHARPSSTGPTAGSWTICPSATSVSRFRTSSSSATASSSRSATGTFRTSGLSETFRSG